MDKGDRQSYKGSERHSRPDEGQLPSRSPMQPVVTQQETEEALQSIRSRLNLDPSTTEPPIDAGSATTKPLRSVHSGRNAAPAKRITAPSQWWIRVSALAASLLIGGILAVWVQPTRIDVPTGSQLSLTLPDGSQVEMAGGSSLEYRRGFGQSHRTLTLTGHAYFDVHSNELPFVAQTGNAQTRVTGTRFTLTHWTGSSGHDVRLSLYSGSVDFITGSDSSETHRISPGTGIRWSDSTHRAERFDGVNEERERIWEQGGISFEDTPLKTVIAALEQIYGIHLILDPEGVQSERVTLYYPQTPSLESMLEDLAQVRGLRLRKTQNGYQLTHDRGL